MPKQQIAYGSTLSSLNALILVVHEKPPRALSLFPRYASS